MSEGRTPEVSAYLRGRYGGYAEDILTLGEDEPAQVDAALARLVDAGLDALPALQRATEAKQVVIRLNVVSVLAAIDHREAIATLQRMANSDRNDQVRGAAREALAGLDGGAPEESASASSEQEPDPQCLDELDTVFANVRKRVLESLAESEAGADPTARLRSMVSAKLRSADAKTVGE